MDEKFVFVYFKTGEEIDEQTKKGIIELHYTADKDFVPPLSERRQKIEDIPNLNSNFLILKHGEKVTGIVVFWDYFRKCRSAYIGNTIVDKSVRNSGLGELLIKECIKCLRHNGVHLVKTNTWPENIPSINMFQKCGFSRYYTVRNARGEGIHKIWLRKFL